jgi:hypothetical protein
MSRAVKPYMLVRAAEAGTLDEAAVAGRFTAMVGADG